MSSEQQKAYLTRAMISFAFLCLLGLSIIGKALYIQLFEGAYWRDKAENLTTVYRDIEATRGNIYAEDGSMLATSVPIYEVRMDMNTDALTDSIFNKGLDSLCLQLALLFKDKSANDWKRQLMLARQQGERYHLIKRKVKYHELKALKEFPIFRMGKYRGGIIILQQNRREKPFRVLAARTIGFDREGVAPVGIEGAYASELRGVSGKRLMQKISGGLWMPLNDENEIEPQDGYDVHTTINLNIQDVAESALLRQLQNHDAEHGCVILMEVQTGEIKAIANLKRMPDGSYWEEYNYAIGESAEPGSTFKLASLMVAIEDGYVKLTDSVETGSGTATFHGETMRDSKEEGHGKISVGQAFEMSSNIGIMRVIEHYYAKQPEKFIAGLRKLGLGSPIGLDIPGEGKPMIKDPSDPSWSLISYLWSSIGYEVKMTPLQTLTFYNAIANEGKMVKPIFVRRVTNRSDVVKSMGTVVMDSKICSDRTLKLAKEMLLSPVHGEHGTAINLRNEHYTIAGKTGTARIAKNKEGYGSTISYQASFVGYFPADAPKYSCIVVVNSPSRSVYYASYVAGPVFEEISDKIYATSIEFHDAVTDQEIRSSNTAIPVSKNGSQRELVTIFDELRIPYQTNNEDNKWVATTTLADKVLVERRNVTDNLVPNVKGMAASDAVFLLENAGLSVQLRGKGTIKSQSIMPGERVRKGDRIVLELS